MTPKVPDRAPTVDGQGHSTPRLKCPSDHGNVDALFPEVLANRREGFVGTSTGPATSLAAEPLLSLAVTVTSEQRVESVLQSIVQG